MDGSADMRHLASPAWLQVLCRAKADEKTQVVLVSVGFFFFFLHFCFTNGVLCNDVKLKKQPFNNTFGLLADGHQERSRKSMLGDDHLTSVYLRWTEM